MISRSPSPRRPRSTRPSVVGISLRIAIAASVGDWSDRSYGSFPLSASCSITPRP
jgi:hypothetical protein